MGIAPVAAGEEIIADIINQLPVVVSYLSTGSVANSTAETIIGTFTIGPDQATFPGGFWWNIFGVATNTGSPTVTMRIRLNSVTGTLLFNPGAVSVSSGSGSQFWIGGGMGFEAIGSSGSFGIWDQWMASFSGATAAQTPSMIDAISIDTTATNTLVLTAQWSAASASNTAATRFGAMYRL